MTSTVETAGIFPQAGQSQNGHPIFDVFCSTPHPETYRGGYIPGVGWPSIPSEPPTSPHTARTPPSGTDSRPARPASPTRRTAPEDTKP